MKHKYKKRIHIISNGISNGLSDPTDFNLAEPEFSVFRGTFHEFMDNGGKSSSEPGDVIIVNLSCYLESFQAQHPANENNSPIIVLVGAHELEPFLGCSIASHCYPVFEPFCQHQIKALVTNLCKQKRLQNNLLSESHYKMLFHKGPYIQMLIDSENGKIVECNHAANIFYNRSSDELKGSCFFDLHAEVSESLQEMLLPVRAKEENRFVLKLVGENQQIKDLEFIAEHFNLNEQSLIYINIQDVSHSIQSGELLHQQHEMLRSTLSSIDDLFFTMNKHGEFIEYYQPGSNNQLSLSSDLFVGKSIKEVGFPENVARKYLDAIDKVLESGRNSQIEYYLDAFGTRLWYNAKITPRRNSLNIAEGVTVLCRDVTRQKKSEETLIRARDFYLTLFNDFPSMIWKTNASKKADYFNKTWLEFTGRTLEQEIDAPWVDKIHYDDAPRFLSVLSEAYHQKKPFQLEHRLQHHDGSHRWVIDVGRPFNNLDGQFAGFIGSSYDITERRNTEDMLRIQRSALENALEGLLIIDAQNEGNPVIYANKELSKITGIALNVINGMNFLEVIGTPDTSEISEKILQAIKLQRTFKGEFFCVNEKGVESWRMILIAPVHDRRGTVAHFVVVLADITESKVSEKILMSKNRELEKTNAELDSFVYSTSHELRSPLMSVLGLINLLEMETPNPDQSKYLGMIKESINKLDQIIHDIINYSRNSRFEVKSEPIQFRSLIEKAIQNLKYLPQAEKLLFQIDIDDSNVFYSDARRMEIIFNSFISNCIVFHNYEQSQPFIRVNVKTLADKATISVEDNGSGISKVHLPRIYDMFFRGSQKSNGGGIGLYIVKEIIEKLDGTIDVSSIEGKETQFVVEIPNQLKA